MRCRRSQKNVVRGGAKKSHCRRSQQFSRRRSPAYFHAEVPLPFQRRTFAMPLFCSLLASSFRGHSFLPLIFTPRIFRHHSALFFCHPRFLSSNLTQQQAIQLQIHRHSINHLCPRRVAAVCPLFQCHQVFCFSSDEVPRPTCIGGTLQPLAVRVCFKHSCDAMLRTPPIINAACSLFGALVVQLLWFSILPECFSEGLINGCWRMFYDFTLYNEK